MNSIHSRTKRSDTFKAVVAGYDCTFEQDLCGWTQGPNITLDWFREQPASNALAGIVGPLTDHTYGNSTGYYVTTRLQIPVSDFNDVDISVLVSPRLPDTAAGPMCADWWYMMHGTDATELNVNFVYDENFNSTQAIWKRRGDQGRHWQHGQLQIDPGNQITRVAYEVIAVWSVRSEVSIDDLTLIDGPCIKPDFHSMDCTFEEDHICGYSSDPTANIAWTRAKGSTPTMTTGAIEGIKHNLLFYYNSKKNKISILDHTLGTGEGHFMYIGM